MAMEVGAFEAKTQLSKLLELVQKGERIIITRRGIPVAQLTAVGAEKLQDTSEVIEELQCIRKRTQAGSDTLQALIEEGRRF
jgi:prevent-host-death family protein